MNMLINLCTCARKSKPKKLEILTYCDGIDKVINRFPWQIFIANLFFFFDHFIFGGLMVWHQIWIWRNIIIKVAQKPFLIVGTILNIVIKQIK